MFRSTHHSSSLGLRCLCAGFFASLLALPALAEDPIAVVIHAESLMPLESCEGQSDTTCAYVTSEVERCSKLVNAGCDLHDGDELFLSGIALEIQICSGPVRRMTFANGTVSYKLEGSCPYDVRETLSVLHDMRPNSEPAENVVAE